MAEAVNPMTIPGWSELAAMLTVLAILGSIFTWIVSVVVDRKLTAFSRELRTDFVSRKELEIFLRQLDDAKERHEKTFSEVWQAINELRAKHD